MYYLNDSNDNNNSDGIVIRNNYNFFIFVNRSNYYIVITVIRHNNLRYCVFTFYLVLSLFDYVEETVNIVPIR